MYTNLFLPTSATTSLSMRNELSDYRADMNSLNRVAVLYVVCKWWVGGDGATLEPRAPSMRPLRAPA